MIKEKNRYNDKPIVDLDNEDYVRRILESGDSQNLEKLANHYNLSLEQLKVFGYFSKLRREILNEMKGPLEERKINNPIATDIELDMGAYQENIEPQVRNTVINLRKKGYATYESGFGGFDSQIISFEKKCLENFKIPDRIINEFRDKGVIIEIKPNKIKLIFKSEFNQEEISSFWQEVEGYFPDLGEPAQPCRLNQAILFRKKQISLAEHAVNMEKKFAENLFSNELFKNLEIAEYPKIFIEMYESGLNVLRDINASDEQRSYAQKYLEVLTSEVKENNDKDLSSFYRESDTNELKDIIFNFTDVSPLAKQRELLGIDSETEKPFDIKVLAPDNWQAMSFIEKEKWWLENTGCPSLFVKRGFSNGKKVTPTIFLSPDDKFLIMQKDEEDENGNKDEINKMFQHEYRHTQRKFGIENDLLFRFIDEACTNVGSYKELAALLHFIGLTTNDFDFEDIKKSYESGNDEDMKNIFKKIKESIGDLGLILIGGKKSSKHAGEYDGIAELPLIKLNSNIEKDKSSDTRFFETLLSIRAKNDLQWLDKLKNNLSVNALKVDRLFLEASISWFLRSYISFADDENTPNINKFLEVIREEIKCRQNLGEEGF